jgi:hypothetical protein
VGQDAAPAGGVRSPALGRPGITVRAHYGALPLSGWTGAGKVGVSLPDGRTTCEGHPGQERRTSRDRKHGPPDRKAAVARSQAPRFVVRRIASQSPCPRLSARRLPSWFRGENCRKTRAHRAARTRAAGCLTFEKELREDAAVLARLRRS